MENSRNSSSGCMWEEVGKLRETNRKVPGAVDVSSFMRESSSSFAFGADLSGEVADTTAGEGVVFE
jgi:hypothetical protein